jgi:hypothetical protein
MTVCDLLCLLTCQSAVVQHRYGLQDSMLLTSLLLSVLKACH